MTRPMADSEAHSPTGSGGGAAATPNGLSSPRERWPLLRLMRPHQWGKSVFILIGPMYGFKLIDPGTIGAAAVATLGAVGAFSLASSGCYVLNDIADREADRAHPRKRLRPIASGAVGLGTARALAVGLLLAGLGCVAVTGAATGWLAPDGTMAGPGVLLLACLLAYIANTLAYTRWLKHQPILDVVSLSMGFVLRVLAGCAAVMVEPSTWLLNCTLFIAMYLSFGKRLGERRTMAESVGGASSARKVQAWYTDALLRMVVVVTAVAALVTYAGYVQSRADVYTYGFNWLWLTTLPAVYGMLRSIMLLELGEYDDPTELAISDRPFQLAVALFGLMTVVLMVLFHRHGG